MVFVRFFRDGSRKAQIWGGGNCPKAFVVTCLGSSTVVASATIFFGYIYKTFMDMEWSLVVESTDRQVLYGCTRRGPMAGCDPRAVHGCTRPSRAPSKPPRLCRGWDMEYGLRKSVPYPLWRGRRQFPLPRIYF